MAKTVKIETIKANANALFRNSDDRMEAQRQAVQYFVADLLMKANAYKGFRYLTAEDVGAGKSIGIIPDYNSGEHVFPDQTRIAFN